jgi:hypothetical protein
MPSTITDRLAAAVDGVAVQGTGIGIVILTQQSGTNNVVCTSFPILSNWVENQIFAWRPTDSNSGDMTLEIEGIAGAKPLKKPNGDSLLAGDVTAGLDIMLRYDGSVLRVMGSGF